MTSAALVLAKPAVPARMHMTPRVRGFALVMPDGTWALVVGGEVRDVGIVGELPAHNGFSHKAPDHIMGGGQGQDA